MLKTIRTCVVCGKKFKTIWITRATCSKKCFMTIYNKNKYDPHKAFLSRTYLEEARKNKGFKDISKETGYSHEWIRQMCLYYGMVGHKQPELAIQRIHILALVKKKKLSDVAKEAGCSLNRLCYHIHKIGIEKEVSESVKERQKTDKVARFWAKVNKNGPFPQGTRNHGRCWLWRGTTISRLGRVFLSNSHVRFSYLLMNKKVPRGKWVIHLCGNMICVNPKHLKAATAKERARIVWGDSPQISK